MLPVPLACLRSRLNSSATRSIRRYFLKLAFLTSHKFWRGDLVLINPRIHCLCGPLLVPSVLADLLWGDRVDSQARQNLRQCILTLRRDFGPVLGRALVVEDQSLAVAADVVEVDALQFVAFASAADFTERQRCIENRQSVRPTGRQTGRRSELQRLRRKRQIPIIRPAGDFPPMEVPSGPRMGFPAPRQTAP